MNASLLIKRGVLVVITASVLSACAGSGDDLDRYIHAVKARPGGRIDPLPEVTPYEVFVYKADKDGLRSPFRPDTPQSAGGGAGGPRPDPNRPREFLEGFPLDTLKMVGTLDMGDTKYGLVQTADGLIHRVIPGNHLGQNDGEITSISESEIDLKEIISDGIGGYIEREAAVSLAD